MALILGWVLLMLSDITTQSQLKSIAVLPFENLSHASGNEFFSDGMTEDIITQLSKIKNLRVISRTSIMRYKNSEKSLREIGDELGVASILEGSVRREGDRVRITAQLIDTNTDGHLWADSYDREMEHIFDLQSEIAQQIVSALRVELSALAAAPCKSHAHLLTYLSLIVTVFGWVHPSSAQQLPSWRA